MCHTTCVSVQDVRYRHNKMCLSSMSDTQQTVLVQHTDNKMHISTGQSHGHTDMYTGQSHTHACSTKRMSLQDKVMHIQTCIQDKVTHMHAQQNVRCYRTKSCTCRHVYMYTYRTKSHTCTKNVSLQVTYNEMHVYTRHIHMRTHAHYKMYVQDEVTHRAKHNKN